MTRPRADRAAVVCRLRDEGLSLRLIAPRVGVSHEQVRLDLKAIACVSPPLVLGADGRWQASRKKRADDA